MAPRRTIARTKTKHSTVISSAAVESSAGEEAAGGNNIALAARSLANNNRSSVSTGNDGNDISKEAYALPTFAAHATRVLKALEDDRRNAYRSSTNVTRSGENVSFAISDGYVQLRDQPSAHKCVLKTQSLKFAEIFASGSRTEVAEVKLDIDPDILRFIINFMYTGKAPDFGKDFPGKCATDCCKRLLLGAKYLKLIDSSAQLIKFCERWLLKLPISLETCVLHLHHAVRYGLPAEGTENYGKLNRAMTFFAAGLPEIMDSEELSSLNGVHMWKIYEMVRNKYGRETQFGLGDRKICIQIWTQCGNRTNVLCSPGVRVDTLKSWLNETNGFPVEMFRLLFKGGLLKDAEYLRSYGIENDDRLDLVLNLVGCVCKCLESKASEMWANTSPELQIVEVTQK